MLITPLGIVVFLHPLIRVLVAVSMIALQLLRLSYTLLPDVTVIDLRFLQLNASSPMLVTLLGIVMDANDSHPQKALSPMLVTLFGIVIDVKDEQFKKALSPILVTLFGMVIDVKDELLEKALSPIAVMVLGMLVFLHPKIRVLVAVSIIALQLLRLSYTLLSAATVMDSRELHPSKDLFILMTLLGMVIEVREEQPLNTQ